MVVMVVVVLSCVLLFATLQTAVLQVPLTIEFCRQEYWSGFPFPPPGGLPGGLICISCFSGTGGQILYHWATWETLSLYKGIIFLLFNKSEKQNCTKPSIILLCVHTIVSIFEHMLLVCFLCEFIFFFFKA